MDSDNGLVPERHQAITWTNAILLSTGPLAANISKMLMKSQTFSSKQMHLKILSENDHQLDIVSWYFHLFVSMTMSSRHQDNIWTSVDPVRWHVSLGLDEIITFTFTHTYKTCDNSQLHQPRIWCCHYLPPGLLLMLGASESLSYSHVSFEFDIKCSAWEIYHTD